MVGKYISYLISIQAVFMLPSVVVALIYGEGDSALWLGVSAAICAVAGTLLHLFCRKAKPGFYARESFVVAGLGWLLISLLGSLPFILSGEIPNFFDAFFETVSGFTTTGASILNDVEALSHGMLFWRSFTHWLGGIGVLAFILAVVRAQSGAGFTLHLLRAESPGPQVGKMVPKTHESVRNLFTIYIGLSLLNLIFLLAGGMPLFDSLCTMFGTAGTGGFGIKNDSLASYSPYLQTVTAVFMMLFGINFGLYFLLLRKEWRAALKDQELRLYLSIIGVSVIGIVVFLMLGGFGGFGASLHNAFFTVSSIITTSGFSITNFVAWPEFCRAILLLLMVIGAMAGSTGGGFKVSRLLILGKSVSGGMYQMQHPRSVKQVKINGKSLDEKVVKGCYIFLTVYCAVTLIGFLLISVDGLTLETNFSAIISCFNNIGPAYGQAAASFSVYSNFSKFVLSFAMLLGRLEIFPLLLLFFPSTWRRKA